MQSQVDSYKYNKEQASCECLSINFELVNFEPLTAIHQIMEHEYNGVNMYMHISVT